ncbi:MAG: hypothetical protein LKF88_04805 [Microbacteriaceae bacterium]|jgi:Arc/MetJ family transcription regulator|nr:hypothetical protein [Microbacteriaceae bacterium]MCI1207514.1 hypothetical protein [Microbacteriaceae bacterium]
MAQDLEIDGMEIDEEAVSSALRRIQGLPLTERAAAYDQLLRTISETIQRHSQPLPERGV